MKLSLIGCGNMAGALLAGILEQAIVSREDILAADTAPGARTAAAERFGIAVTEDNGKAAAEADVLILAVKPQFLADVIAEIRGSLKEEAVVISLAPGKTLAWLEEQFGRPVRLVRTMPNTPAMVGEGMTALCMNAPVTEEQRQTALALFGSVGRAAVVPEGWMDTVTGVSGSSPAYVFLFIEALADAAVEGGMPRKEAYTFAAQSVLGSAKMVLESGKHPGELKDMVTSPAGTTIEAVRVLEERGFRSAVIEATRACIQRSKGM